MDDMKQEISRLRSLLDNKDKEIDHLNKVLSEKEHVKSVSNSVNTSSNTLIDSPASLSNDDISRYSRQLILPEIGPKGQLLLKRASVLIVGAGGLGCPAGIYLAAAGIGRLGVVDYDEVELSNLHRQILHTEHRVGMAKSLSIGKACNDLNSSVKFESHHIALNSSNAMELIQKYDVIMDATDNVATRYLLNDACVLSRRPLVSGSALRFEGQLTVYNHKDGPCYRCLYPKPPPPETVTNCSDGGVLGVVPGIIGCLQALEAVKLITGIGTSYSGRLLLFDGLQGSFRTIRLRGRQDKCNVCGNQPSINKLIDYEQFCGAQATDKTRSLALLKSEDRISVQRSTATCRSFHQDYRGVCTARQPHLLVDVRQPVELEICQLPHTYNLPIDKIDRNEEKENLVLKIKDTSPKSVFVLCRQGNDSQEAVIKLREMLKDIQVEVKDIKGGLRAWSKHIDPSFPVY